MIKPSRHATPEHARRGLSAWLRQRVDLDPLLAMLRRKPVPMHRHTWIYLLGDALIFLFALQVVTGCLLVLYYQPTEAAAHQSIHKIMTEVPYGWLVRSVHVWGASLLMATAGLHLWTVLWARAYRRPRELTWISGMLMLTVVMVSGFSGYLLPWNELSYCATRVGTQIPGKLPWIGPGLVRFVRGGEQLTGDTITRFFAAHVMLAPLTLFLLLAMHVFLSRVRGLSLPFGMSERDVRDRRPFFSEFLLIDVCLWLVLFGALVTVSVVWPAAVGVQADPLQPAPEGIKPEWYFLFLFQTLKVVPEALAMMLWALAAGFLFGLPFLDRGAQRGRNNPGVSVACVILLAYVVLFEILAIVTPGVKRVPEALAAETYRPAANLVSLALFWLVIGFLVFYLWRLAGENARVRALYRDSRRGEKGD